ncbi:MAG TPA: hypothetical protein VGP82_00060 [Ktedonobacterales bacterium]|jgi:hypothetical protein|nr:hypothetical protein [Ktedonobacterales bacterium]
MDDETTNEPSPLCVLLAGIDTLHFSAEANVSKAVRAKLDEAKEAAQLAAKENAVHCPDWLGARVHPSGARGGYGHLIETEDFTIKVLGANIPNRPGLYVELRSLFLHTDAEGARGACEEALCWIRDQLLYDQDETTIQRLVSFEGVKLSRVDLHMDWQGGWEPSPADALNFVKPARVKWQVYSDGTTFTGIAFGRGALMARIYRKSLEVREKQNEAYLALLSERKPDTFDLHGDIWRLEFQLRREGTTGFRLYREPDAGDDADIIEAELAAEDLPHIGTLPRLFTHMEVLWKYLTNHTLRLVEPSEAANRSRWPVHPTWAHLRDTFAEEASCQPLDEDQRELVRGMRFEGKGRLLRRMLRRMLLGVIASLELEDASPTSAALAAISKWVDEAARCEAERAEARRTRYLARYGHVPAWVERGMGQREARARQVRHRVQMLLGIFSARGVLPLELKPAHSVGDLLVQHLDDLEREAKDKGGLDQVLADHFSRIYKVAAPRDLFTVKEAV